MKLQIERRFVEAMVQGFPELGSLMDQLRFGEKVEVEFGDLSDPQLNLLQDLYRKAGPEMQVRAAQIATLQRALSDNSTRFTERDLEQVVPAIVRYLVTGATRGWMFTASAAGRPLPYVVTRLDYTPPSNDETGRVFIELKANAKGSMTTTTFKISVGDIVGKTIAEIFAAKRFLRETPELIAAYDGTAERYFSWRGQYGAQFSGKGTGFYTEDPNSSHRDTDWSRKDVVVLSSAATRHASSTTRAS
jgi:hypothetical protein